MKLNKLIIGALVAVSLGSCSHKKQNNYYGVFKEAEIESIRPESWLNELLQRQRDGLGLHRHESGYPYNTCLWNGIIPKGGNPIAKGWWPYEQSGYMVDGLYRTGIFLRDSVLMNLGSANVGYVLSHPRCNGMLGPECLGENQWAFSVFVRSMLAYYDFSGDERVPVMLTRHFEALGDSLTNRQACIIESMCKIYSYTGDKSLLAKACNIWDSFSRNGGSADNEAFIHEDMVDSKSIAVHGVTAAEVSKQPAILYLYTGRKEYLDAVLGFYSSIEKNNELPDGIPVSCENIGEKEADGLHETCDISDFLWSYGYLLMATGDVRWADKMETAAYNAALGAIGKDFKTLQYFSSPNQLFATEKSSKATYGEEGLSRQAYRPGFDVECCSGNVHRMFPNFISRMWMRGADNAVVAALYGPSEYVTTIEGSKVSITEDTMYPFSGKITFRFSTDGDGIEFPFIFRIPDWAESCDVTVNGSEKLHYTESGFESILRKFRTGDIVELEIGMTPRMKEFCNNGISVYRGPLLYSLDIKEQVDTVTGQFKTSADFPAYNVRPASKFNYGLAVDSKIEVVETGSTSFPWDPDSTPVRLKVAAYGIPQWKYSDERTPALPEGIYEVASDCDTVEMIPSGCTRIRMTVLPAIKSEKNNN